MVYGPVISCAARRSCVKVEENTGSSPVGKERTRIEIKVQRLHSVRGVCSQDTGIARRILRNLQQNKVPSPFLRVQGQLLRGIEGWTPKADASAGYACLVSCMVAVVQLLACYNTCLNGFS